jgi:hypothetical protein
VGHIRAWLPEVHPFHILVFHDSTGQASTVAFRDGFRENKRTGCDVEVFFLFSIDPFHYTLNDEGAEIDFSTGEFDQVVLRQAWSTVVKDEERAKNSSLVRVDEDVLVGNIVADGNFRGNHSSSAGRLEVVHELLTSLVNAVDVSVDVDTITVGPIIRLVDVEFVESFPDLNLIDVFGNVNHLGSVLHQTTILSLRGFVGAKAAPLRRVKVSSFEVRLATDQWRGDTAHVGEGGQVGSSVQQLAHARATSDPVSCGEGVHDFAGENVGAEA